MRVGRVLLGLSTALAGGVVAGLLAAAIVPFAFGARPMTVMSGSMAPAIETGDAVIVDSVDPHDVRVGEVVTFRDPQHNDRLITHRLRGVRYDGARAQFVTRGDANNKGERWSVPVEGTIGRVVYRLPRAGYLSRAAASPRGPILLVIVPALLLGGWALVRIWRPAGRDDASGGALA